MRARKLTFKKTIFASAPEFMTAYQVAKLLDVSRVCVSLWISQNGMPAIPRDDGTYIIERDVLAAWLKQTGRMK